MKTGNWKIGFTCGAELGEACQLLSGEWWYSVEKANRSTGISEDVRQTVPKAKFEETMGEKWFQSVWEDPPDTMLLPRDISGTVYGNSFPQLMLEVDRKWAAVRTKAGQRTTSRSAARSYFSALFYHSNKYVDFKCFAFQDTINNCFTMNTYVKDE